MIEIEQLTTLCSILMFVINCIFVLSIFNIYCGSLHYAEKKARRDLIKNKNLCFGDIERKIKGALIGLRDYGIDISIIEFVSINEEYVIYKYKDKFYRADIGDEFNITQIKEFAHQIDLTRHLDYLAWNTKEINA